MYLFSRTISILLLALSGLNLPIGGFCESGSATNATSVKAKRGIFNLAYPGAISGLSYNVPPAAPIYYDHGLAKPWITNPLVRFPTIVKSVVPQSPSILPTVPFGLSPGGAVVTSYNVNYPRFPYVSQKPFILNSAPALRPLFPASPPLILPQKPIIPFAVPSFTNQVPIVLPKPQPTFTVFPSLGTPPVVPPTTITPFQPQFVPIPLPAQPPTISTIPATVPVPVAPSTFITNSQPDPWRPIIVTGPSTTAATPFSRPSLTLLPPYSSNTNDQRSAQLELQSIFNNYQAGQELNQLYQSPDESQHHFNEQEFTQDTQQHQRLQHHHDLQQGHHHINAINSNGQGYSSPSAAVVNHGSYSGPSSYEVRLNTRTTTYD